MEELNTTQFGISWLGAIFQLSKGIGSIPGGYLLDHFGASRCIKAGAIIILLASACYPFAQSLWQLLVLHAIFGLTYDLSGLGPFIVFTTSWFDRTRACAITILVSAFSMAGVLFPPIIAGVIERNDWRYAAGTCTVFYAALGLPLLFCVVYDGPLRSRTTVTTSERSAEANGHPSPDEEQQEFNRGTSPFEVCSNAADAPEASMHHEPSNGLPQNFLHSLKSVALWHLALINFYNTYVIIALINTLVLYLKKDAGIPLELCGTYNSLVNISSVFGKLVVGLVLDGRFQSQASLSSYLLLILGTSLSLDLSSGSLRPTSSRSQLWLFSVVYGLGFGASYSVTVSKPAKIFGSMPDFGKVQAFLMLFQTIGGVAGTLITSKLREATGSFTASFCVFVVMAVLCVLHCILLNLCSARQPQIHARHPKA